jgi:hypothetical protein
MDGQSATNNGVIFWVNNQIAVEVPELYIAGLNLSSLPAIGSNVVF